MTLKKKFVVASRANYGRVKYLLKELKKSKNRLKYYCFSIITLV